jgi:hypothetical protein
MRMSNGYLLAAEADLETARGIADGLGLELISAASIADHEATGAALAAAPSVGLILSAAAAQDQAFVALLRSLAQQLSRAQLILVEADARAAFAFLPENWPAMALEEARMRASELARQREAATGGAAEQAPRAEEAPQESAAPEAPSQAEPEAEEKPSAEAAPSPEPGEESAPPTLDSRYGDMSDAMGADRETAAAEPPPAPVEETPPAAAAPQMPPAPEPGPAEVAPEPPPSASTPEPPPMAAPAPQTAAPARRTEAPQRSTRAAAPATAPADATAFAPRKLRRETPELVRIVVHQPKDLQAVIKAARRIDPRAAPAPQGMSIGEVALGASIGVALEVRGGACDGTLQRRTWAGEPIDFAFTVEAEAGVKQAVFVARVFVDDAQIGVVAFTRPIKGPAKKPAGLGDRVRLRRHKRVFLSYSSNDREVVSAIATAYQMAGVQHFWDRASLKSGEEWSPRLRREIDRADLFHLCWSKAAAASEWVEKEAEHALTRRRRTNGKKPEITVQMLDGPPWAPHPPSLASINFDDFVRAAIIGYARGEG